MLPDNEALRHALNTLEVAEGTLDREGDVVLVARQERRLPDGQFASDRSDVVLRQSDGPISANRLAERVADELHAAGHPCSAKRHPARVQVASTVLGLVALTRRSNESALQSVNNAIRLVGPARLYSCAVLPNTTGTGTKHQFGDFTYGKLDLEKLRERCNRAGSDYFELYGEKLRDHLSLHREDFEIDIFDPSRMTANGRIDRDRAALGYRIVDEYYGIIARDAQERFLVDLDRQQAVYGVAGLGTIPSEALMKLGVTSWIHVFTRRERRHGWVVPFQEGLTLIAVDPGAYADGLARIHSRLAISDWGERPLDEIAQRFCEYCTAADVLKNNGRLEEAFLHIVFGLDLLLGGEATESLATALSERVAILVHQAMERPITEIVRFIRDSYDMRSGYAHRGHRGDFDSRYEGMRLSDRVDELVRICRAVLAAACFARVQPWSQSGDARSSWIARLDVLRTKHRAEIPFAPVDLQDLGLDRVRFASDGIPAVIVNWDPLDSHELEQA